MSATTRDIDTPTAASDAMTSLSVLAESSSCAPSAATPLFAWREFIDDSGQEGINCAIFRNESKYRSSDLIRQADAIADAAWPHRRHYTYVDPTKVRSANPGFCFIAAGWKRCGRTKGGLIVLDREIPFELARHIAAVYKPRRVAAA